MNNEEFEGNKTISRRKIIAGSVVFAAAAGVSRLSGIFGRKSQTQSQEEGKLFLAPKTVIPTPEPTTKPSPIKTPKVEILPIPNVKPPVDIEKFKDTDEQSDILNKILSCPLDNQDRLRLEISYLEYVNKKGNLNKHNIDKGLWVISKSELRKDLLELRYRLRQQDKNDILNKNPDLLTWAQQNNIHPEVLGICLDSYKQAEKTISLIQSYLKQKGGYVIYEGVKYSLDTKLNPTQFMINPGGMAALVSKETSGFVNIGHVAAISEINFENDAFPTAIDDLYYLLQKLDLDTNLDFSSNNGNIPGSPRGDETQNLSGGAIGLQFMANQAFAMYQIMESVGYKFNPFDPNSSVIGAWVFLALQKDWVGFNGNITVGTKGYLRGESKEAEAAKAESIKSWNPKPSEIKFILNIADDFYAKFPTLLP